MGRKKKPVGERYVPIMFKVSPEIFRAYEEYGKTIVDDNNEPLSPALAARALAKIGLKAAGRLPKSKKA